MRRTSGWAVALLGWALLGSCSSGPSLTEYAEQVETLVNEMNTDIAALDATLETDTPTVQLFTDYFENRVAIRTDFMEGFRALEVPGQVEELQETALRVLDRLLAAEESMAVEVSAAQSLADVTAVFESDVRNELVNADLDSVALCQAAQAEFDATQEEALAAGTPWVPAELKEVVRVTLNCGAIPE